MRHSEKPDPTRRLLLKAFAAAPLVIAFPSFLGSACSVKNGAANATELEPTLSCVDDDDDDATIAQTEGPFFKASSPERTSLIESGTAGTRLALTGLVLTRSCKPVSGALVDFWHTDSSGNYDNSTYGFRGHQFTRADGVYRLDTIVPGLYPGRTRHFHVRVQAPAQSILTTQLYFPEEARNASDGIYHESLLIDVTDTGSTKQGRFNFVLNLA